MANEYARPVKLEYSLDEARGLLRAAENGVDAHIADEVDAIDRLRDAIEKAKS